jgi:hypothetical protein
VFADSDDSLSGKFYVRTAAVSFHPQKNILNPNDETDSSTLKAECPIQKSEIFGWNQGGFVDGNI